MSATDAVYRHPESAEHLLRSRLVPQTFRIMVATPMRRTDRSERFPVLYTTDGDMLFGGLATLANILQIHGETPRFILVGIGYENAKAAELLRWRDLATHEIRARFAWALEQVARSQLVQGMVNLEVIAETTDAAAFLNFVHEELMSFIDARYPTIPGDCSYFGYSAGGTFGLYTLFNRPETFARYILGSPGTSCDGHNFAIDLAKAFVESGKSMSARVFMSVGELEEFKRGFDRFDLVSGYYGLAKFLKAAEIPGLELTLQVFSGETHATAWAPAFSRGTQRLFGPVDDVPFTPDFHKRAT